MISRCTATSGSEHRIGGAALGGHPAGPTPRARRADAGLRSRPATRASRAKIRPQKTLRGRCNRLRRGGPRPFVTSDLKVIPHRRNSGCAQQRLERRDNSTRSSTTTAAPATLAPPRSGRHRVAPMNRRLLTSSMIMTRRPQPRCPQRVSRVAPYFPGTPR